MGEARFTTEGRKNRAVEIGEGRTLSAIRIIEPAEGTIRTDQLPRAFRWKLRRILVFKQLGPDAIILDELLSGIDIRLELYYEEDRPSSPRGRYRKR